MEHHNGRGRASNLIGFALLGVGLVFLIGQLLSINLIYYLWPFFVIVPGLLFFMGMVLGGKRLGALAIPGSIITMVGLILLYQNTFKHFESWAYAWALIFPTAVGIGLAVNGAWSGIPALVERGSRWVSAGLVIFLVTGFFFELVLNISNSVIGNLVWPGLLIAFGAYLALRGGRRRETPQAEQPPQPPSGHEPEFEALDLTHLHRR